MRIVCIATLIIIIISQRASAQQVTNQRIFDTVGFIPEHYPQRISQFEKEPMTKGGIIFLGNSITEIGDWKKITGDSTVLNRGIAGDITFGVLKRLDEIIRRQPDKLFLLIGINDIGKDIPDAVIADNIRKIIMRIQNESPGTRIYLQSILPLNPYVPNFPQHYDKQSHVLSTNHLLEQVALSIHCKFVNIHPLFLDSENKMDKKYTFDGLHINKAGYEIWVKFLRDSGCLN